MTHVDLRWKSKIEALFAGRKLYKSDSNMIDDNQLQNIRNSYFEIRPDYGLQEPFTGSGDFYLPRKNSKFAATRLRWCKNNSKTDHMKVNLKPCINPHDGHNLSYNFDSNAYFAKNMTRLVKIDDSEPNVTNKMNNKQRMNHEKEVPYPCHPTMDECGKLTVAYIDSLVQFVTFDVVICFIIMMWCFSFLGFFVWLKVI